MNKLRNRSVDNIRQSQRVISVDQSTACGIHGKQFSKAICLGLGLLVVSPTASSAQATKHSCTIERISDGSIQPNIANRKLTSKRFGGFAGRMKITATRGRYRLVVDDPLGFSHSPANGGDAVRMQTSFLGNGATNFAERPGNEPIKIKKGVTFVETHFVAKKLNQKTFPAGNYHATLTLRCE